MILAEYRFGDYVVFLYEEGFTVFHGRHAEFTAYAALLFVIVPTAALFFLWTWRLPDQPVFPVFLPGVLLGTVVMFMGVSGAPGASAVSAVLMAAGAALSFITLAACAAIWALAGLVTGKSRRSD